jgi:hypothetical protein
LQSQHSQTLPVAAAAAQPACIIHVPLSKSRATPQLQLQH